MEHLPVYVFIGFHVFFLHGLGTFTAFSTNKISRKIPLDEQNIFSKDVYELQNYTLQSSDNVKPY